MVRHFCCPYLGQTKGDRTCERASRTRVLSESLDVDTVRPRRIQQALHEGDWAEGEITEVDDSMMSAIRVTVRMADGEVDQLRGRASERRRQARIFRVLKIRSIPHFLDCPTDIR